MEIELPEGFRFIAVEVSESEYEAMCLGAETTKKGTISALVRVGLGMLERPIGIVKAETEFQKVASR